MALLSVTLAQPALVSDRARSDYVRSTHRYVTGAVIRGAFAAAWIARHNDPASSARREEFVALFEGGVRFAPLFVGPGFRPLSVVGHKYAVPDECAESEIDLAVDPTEHLECPDCGADLVPRHGLAAAGSTHRRISVSIGAAGVARRGQLFARECLEATQTFTGHLVADNPDLLRILADLQPIRIGGRRTTHGRATVTIDETASPPLPQRLGDGHLVLRLRSPAVFVDDYGRPVAKPSAREIADGLGLSSERTVAVERSWVRWDQVGGWHAASGLPKPMELAVAPGSTYVVRVDKTFDDTKLSMLAAQGLGLRRHEGFGDLGGTYTPEESPKRRRENEKRKIAAYAGVQSLSLDDRNWQLVLSGLGRAADGDQQARDDLRAFAHSRISPPATDAPLDAMTVEAADRLLDLLKKSDETLRLIHDAWTTP